MSDPWMQCDCCARLTDRLHYCVAYGLDTAACDQCSGYEAEAYDEPPARYLDEQEDPEEVAYAAREPDARDTP
jgi:hypothetical protein